MTQPHPHGVPESVLAWARVELRAKISPTS